MTRPGQRDDRSPPARAAAGTASTGGGATAAIDALVRRTRWILLWERAWPPISALVAVVALFVALSWLGFWLWTPVALRLAGLALLAVAAGFALWRIARLRFPDRALAMRRIERASNLADRPLTAIEDGLATGDDPVGRALWQAHRQRILARLVGMRSGWPAPQAFRGDPWGLRAVVGLLLFIGFFVGTGDHWGRLGSAFAPFSVPAGEPPMRLDAWVTPPAYTGRPPVFLTGEGRVIGEAPIRLPAGSMVVVRIHGADDASVAREDAVGTSPVAPEAAAVAATAADRAADERAALRAPAREFHVALDGDAAVSVARRGEHLARWRFAVDPDAPPAIAFDGEPKVAASGAIQLAYTVADDYGVAEAEAIITPADPALGAAPLVAAPKMPLVLPSRLARSGRAETMQDLTAHPWAGAAVTITLVARDEAGQEGRSASIDWRLPERSFRKPLARAIVEQRRTLALDAGTQDAVIDALAALMLVPEGLFDTPTSYIGTRMVFRSLYRANDAAALSGVIEEMWNLALAIEDGDLSLAARALRDAQEALRRAIENNAPPEEIARLTEELRQAMERFLSSLAEQMRNNPQAQQRPLDPNAQVLRPQDLDRMLDRIEELARQGSLDAAQQLLSELQQMLENLQAARPMQPGQNGEQGQGPLDELGRMIQEQQRLLDQTYRLDRGQPQDGKNGQGGEPMSPEELQEALRNLQRGQGDLAQKLQELMDQLGQGQGQGQGQAPGQKPGDQAAEGEGQGAEGGQNGALGQAGDAMGRARDALGRSATGEAVGPQSDALDALRRGAQALAEQMYGEGQPGRGPGGQSPSAQNQDPLGRMRRTDGPDLGTSVRVPEEIDVQRAREILDELRRRLGDSDRPRPEIDYLERLLPQN